MEEQNTTFSVTSPKRKRHFVKRRKEDLKVFIVTKPIEEDEDDNETNWKKVAYQLIPSKSTPTKDHYVCHIEDLNDNNIDKVRVGVLVENNSNNAFSVQINKMGEIKVVIKQITSSSPNELSNEILNNVGVSILSNTNANKIKQNKLTIKPLSVNCKTKTFTGNCPRFSNLVNSIPKKRNFIFEYFTNFGYFLTLKKYNIEVPNLQNQPPVTGPEEIIIIEDDINSEHEENFTDNLISKLSQIKKKDFLH
ncbi:hypothetical protein ABK040_000440 [Willaertia magna]